MTTKWNVTVGDTTEEISSDLCIQLGLSAPYSNDPAMQARDERHDKPSFRMIAEQQAAGYHEDRAARFAIRLMVERKTAQTLETARQKVAELELAAAKERKAAATLELQAQQFRRESQQ